MSGEVHIIAEYSGDSCLIGHCEIISPEYLPEGVAERIGSLDSMRAIDEAVYRPSEPIWDAVGYSKLYSAGAYGRGNGHKNHTRVFLTYNMRTKALVTLYAKNPLSSRAVAHRVRVRIPNLR